MKTLVVYYSRKGYVQKLAMQKVRDENADFLEIETIENSIREQFGRKGEDVVNLNLKAVEAGYNQALNK